MRYGVNYVIIGAGSLYMNRFMNRICLPRVFLWGVVWQAPPTNYGHGSKDVETHKTNTFVLVRMTLLSWVMRVILENMAANYGYAKSDNQVPLVRMMTEA